MTITWICSCVRSVLFPKQGNKIKVVVLNRVCILGIFVLNSVRISNLQRLNYTQILVEYQPGTLACLRSTSSSTTPILLSRALFHSPLPRRRHVDPPPALALLTLPPSSYTSRTSPSTSISWLAPLGCATLFTGPPSSSSPSQGATWFYLSIILALHLGAIGRIWLGTSNFSALWESLHGHFKDSDG